MSATASAPTGLAIPFAPRADRWVAACWYLLCLYALGFVGDSVLPIPQTAPEVVRWGALLLALVIAFLHNPRLQIRPNALLALITVLVLASVPGVLLMEGGIGSVFPLAKYAIFLAVLWLLSPAMANGLQFVRYHMRFLCAVIAQVLVGLVLAPGLAMNGSYGRLGGVLWPLRPSGVASYAGVLVGLTTVLVLHRLIDRRTAAVLLVAGVATLLLTRTRTPLIAMVLGLGVVIAGQALVSARARRFLVWSVGLAGLAAIAFMPLIMGFLRRGQGGDWLSSLTGRSLTWQALLSEERSSTEHWFGHGLGQRGISSRTIDNTWLAAYHKQGMVGVTIIAIVFLTVLLCALIRPPSPERSCALFLVVNAVASSYTKTAISGPSEFLLELFVAVAALIAADGARPAARAVTQGPIRRSPPPRVP